MSVLGASGSELCPRMGRGGAIRHGPSRDLVLGLSGLGFGSQARAKPAVEGVPRRGAAILSKFFTRKGRAKVRQTCSTRAGLAERPRIFPSYQNHFQCYQKPWFPFYTQKSRIRANPPRSPPSHPKPALGAGSPKDQESPRVTKAMSVRCDGGSGMDRCEVRAFLSGPVFSLVKDEELTTRC